MGARTQEALRARHRRDRAYAQAKADAKKIKIGLVIVAAIILLVVLLYGREAGLAPIHLDPLADALTEEEETRMIRPMRNRPYPERSKDCQFALEVHVQELLDKAMAAGWERKEAMTTIANLVINFMVADAENEHTNVCIARALGRVEH